MVPKVIKERFSFEQGIFFWLLTQIQCNQPLYKAEWGEKQGATRAHRVISDIQPQYRPFFCATFWDGTFFPLQRHNCGKYCFNCISTGGTCAKTHITCTFPPQIAKKPVFGGGNGKQCDKPFCAFSFPAQQHPQADAIGGYITCGDVIRTNVAHGSAKEQHTALNMGAKVEWTFVSLPWWKGHPSQLTVSAIHVIIWGTLGHQCGVVDVSRIRVYGHVWVHLFKQGWEWPSQILQS